MNRCLVLPVALALALFLALPVALGATDAHRGRARINVGHETIHRAPRKGSKRSCRRAKTHKHGKRAATCKTHKRSARRSHKRGAGQTHKRGAGQTHTRVVRHTHPHAAGHSRPATASRDCPDANLTPRTDNIEGVVAATLCLVNDERARFGELALIEDPRLASIAAGHSRDMDTHDYFAHVSPDGQTLLMRVQASGFIPNGNVGYTLGENIAWGTLWLGTPNSIVKAWMESPGHRANILNAGFRYTGVGIDPNLPRSMSGGQAGGMYTQDFGTIIG